MMISEKKSEMIESLTDLNGYELKLFPHSRKITTNIYLSSNAGFVVRTSVRCSFTSNNKTPKINLSFMFKPADRKLR